MQRVILPEIDPASIEDAVGAACYAKGVQYWRQRAVVHMWWDDAQTALHGTVHGRTGEFYTTTAYFSLVDGLPPEFEQGECSCPVGFNCKHAAALILAAADTATARTTTARAAVAPTASPQGGPRSVAWQAALGSLLEPRPAVAASAVTTNVYRVGQAALVLGRPQRWRRSLRMRARSRRWAARMSGWRALALRQRR